MYPLFLLLEGDEWILLILAVIGVSVIFYRAGYNNGRKKSEHSQLQRQLDQIRKKQTIDTDSIQL